MRVTKVIKEYIEKKIMAKCQEELDKIKVEPYISTEEYKAKHEEYMAYAEEKFADFTAALATKRNELGIPIVAERSWGKQNFTYEQGLWNMLAETIYSHPTTTLSLASWIDDAPYKEYNKCETEIRTKYRNKIDDVVIRLELGEIAKQELEDVLAEI